MHYGFGITEDTIDLVTFLNDGVRPPIEKNTFLICEVNGPREITTKVVHESELTGTTIANLIHMLP